MEYSIVVVAGGESAAGLRFVAPYAAMAMGEYFMRAGRDALIVLDDLGSHARAYRELSLLLRRPPGRESFPGDIFYIHSRLLERSTHLRPELGGGSLTALPIVETEEQNIAAYIPTNLISITDGQIYLSPDLSAERDSAGRRCRQIRFARRRQGAASGLPRGRRRSASLLLAVRRTGSFFALRLASR